MRKLYILSLFDEENLNADTWRSGATTLWHQSALVAVPGNYAYQHASLFSGQCLEQSIQ